MRKIILSIAFCSATLVVWEMSLRHWLFRSVSYSNSESIDQQLKERDEDGKWTLLFVGDSETRWGIDPMVVDESFREAGAPARAFNHAFDGFGASWWARMLPSVIRAKSLQDVRIVAVGIQMITEHRVLSASGEDCGALQRPVLTSAYAIDLGIDSICIRRTWDERLARRLFDGLWTVRYTSAVRSMVLPEVFQRHSVIRFGSRKAGVGGRGFEGHRSIAQDRDSFDEEFEHWKAQFNPDTDFVPLEASIWPRMTAAGGFFDQLKAIVESTGCELVLFALPTNPLVIDTFRRRTDYQRNSKLLARWAERSGVAFFDFGIQDVGNPEAFFSDMRHLSVDGSRLFSTRLGKAMAGNQIVRRGLTNAVKSVGSEP